MSDEIMAVQEEENETAEAPEEEAEAQSEAQAEPAVNLEKIEAMAKAGLFYGRRKSKTHPKMKPLVAANRNTIELFDLMKTEPMLTAATDFLGRMAAEGKTILFVATQPAARDLIADLAVQYGYPYVTNKWVGGALTNLNVIRKRIGYFASVRADKESGRLKRSKKEMARINREIGKMEFLFSGIEKMDRLPEAMFIVNPKLHVTALREAKKVKIPTVAILSTDVDPKTVEYPIPANDNSRSSIEFILREVKKAIGAASTNPPAGGVGALGAAKAAEQ